MPEFPSFQRRLAEFNNPMGRSAEGPGLSQPDNIVNPMQRRPRRIPQVPGFSSPLQDDSAETPMQVGGIPRPRNLVSPMQKQPKRTLPPGVGELGPDDVQPMRGQLQMDTSMIRPMGEGGQIPLVQDGLPQSSGTEPDPQTNRPAGGLIQRKVAQDAGFDVGPTLEEIPTTPEFAPREVKGVWGRIKSAFQAAGGASRMYPDRPLAPLVGAIAGAVDPRIAQVMHHQGVVLPQAFQRQQQVMQRNDARQKSFGLELQNRERMAKIQEAGQPDYAPLGGGEYPMLYNKKDPTQTHIPLGPDGKPVRNAGNVTGDNRNEMLERVNREKIMAQAERDAAKAETQMVLKQQDAKIKTALAEYAAKARMEQIGAQQSGATGRTKLTNAAADKRNKDRIDARRGDDDDEQPSTQPRASTSRPRNVFETVATPQFDSPFGFKSKTPATPGLPPASGTSPSDKKKKRQLPPGSGTGN